MCCRLYNLCICVFEPYTADTTKALSSLTDTSARKPVTMTTGSEFSSNKVDEATDVESAYKRAVEFIESVNRLRAVPDQLRERYESVKSCAVELRETVESMRRQADEIKV